MNAISVNSSQQITNNIKQENSKIARKEYHLKHIHIYY